MIPLIDLQEVEIFRDTGELHRRMDHLEIHPRSRIGIIGGCDTGKTALAFLLAGIASPSHARGSMRLNGIRIEEMSEQDRARRIAFVPTAASLVFSGMRTTVYGELELSLQIVGYGSEARSSIAQLVKSLALESLLDRDPFTLSGGEQVRAALALVMVKSPDLIILDDVFSALDTEASEIVQRTLLAVHGAGVTIVEFHSCSPSWVDTFDECIYLCPGQVLRGRYSDVWRDVGKHAPDLLPLAGQIAAQFEAEFNVQAESAPVSPRDLTKVLPSLRQLISDRLRPSAGRNSVSTCGEALATRNWNFRYSIDGFQLGPLSFSVSRGQAVAVLGPNGSGKTTLLRTLALLLIAESGTLEVHTGDGSIVMPPAARFRHTWARHVLYAFQNPDDQIYLPTVWGELTETAKACGLTHFDDLAKEVAATLMLGDVLQRAPVDLPRPLRRLVTLGSCFTARAPILLLDEPSAGLDSRQKRQVGRALQDYLAAGGTGIVVSHDYDFVLENCSSAFIMENGRLMQRHDLLELNSESWPTFLQCRVTSRGTLGPCSNPSAPVHPSQTTIP